MSEDQFINNVKSVLENKGWTKTQLSKETGISYNIINNVLSGRPFTLTRLMEDKIKELLDDNDPRTTAEIEEENKELLKKLVEVQEKLLREKEANQITKEDYENKINEILTALQIMREKIDKLN